MRRGLCLAMLFSWSCGDSGADADTETPASSTDTEALGTTGPSSAETSSDSGAPLDSSGSSTASDSGSTGGPCEPVLVFSDDFDDLGPPFSREFPGLPDALFALDRFTQVQLEPQRSGNTIALVDGRSGLAIDMIATGQPRGIASKMDLGKTAGIAFEEGQIAHLQATFFIDTAVGIASLTSTTLLDLEDGNDIQVDGEFPTPGLRVAVNADGLIILDRGEIPGRETPKSEAIPRLSSMRSDQPVPLDQWFTLEAVIKLGIGVAKSQVPIDETFDALTTPGWCELYVTTESNPRQRILRMAGATSFDAEAALEVFAELQPRSEILWPESVDFDVFQVGLTNNRSTADEHLLVDEVVIELGCPEE